MDNFKGKYGYQDQGTIFAINAGMMKKIISISISIVFLAVSLIASGCDETGQANKFISQANKHIDKGNLLQQDINRLLEQIDNSKDGKKTLKLSRQFESKTKSQQKEAQQSILSFKKAFKLNISENFKTYLDMEVKASQVNLESVKTKSKLASVLVDLWESGLNKTLSQQEANMLEKQAASLTKTGVNQENKYNKLHQKANAFRKKELGF